MTDGRRVRAALAALTLTLVAWVVLPATASAHTLDSSSVRIVVGDTGLDGTISLAVAALDAAFDADRRSGAVSADAYEAEVLAYVDEHLIVVGSGGEAWVETYSNFVRQTTEGIETITVDVAIDAGGDDPADFAITYDAIIEAVGGHDAVLVLESAGGVVSTPGVFSTSESTLTIGEHATSVGAIDMVRFGFHHVLDGADHLLFLVTLLLPAPLIAAGRRWRHEPKLGRSVRRVVHVVTAFTVGHSITLVASALGWVDVPSRPVEVLIAASVAVSAVHAIRPIVRGGEPAIAVTFGLVHGLAFAGILRDLGLDGRTSLLALFAFNLGIELAQLAVTACLFPSLHLIAIRDRAGVLRTAAAVIALAASIAWMLDRLGVLSNPIAPIEQALVEHPGRVVLALAAIAVAVTASSTRHFRPTAPVIDDVEDAEPVAMLAERV